jgi:hypothetical protein
MPSKKKAAGKSGKPPARPADRSTKTKSRTAAKGKGGTASGRRLTWLVGGLLLSGSVLLGLVLLAYLHRPLPPPQPVAQKPDVSKPAPVIDIKPSPAEPAPAAPGPAPPESGVRPPLFTAPVPAENVPAGSPGRVAIIMDDLGRDLASARELLAIDLPVTFAVLPMESHSAEVAEMAHAGGREVLIHLPMQPQGYPDVDPGDAPLLVGQRPEDIRERIALYRQRVPQAVGGNNHMGSRFTEDRAGMAVVLEEMRQEGLFFVDSLTSGRSVAFDEARRQGIPAAERDLFLDNEREVGSIAREIRRLAELGRRQGGAVGICHPHPQTLQALRQEAAYLRRQGIEVVPVSQLLVR